MYRCTPVESPQKTFPDGATDTPRASLPLLYIDHYVLAAGVALALVPHFGWQSAFIVAVIPAVVLFVVRRGVTESHRYTDVRARVASGLAKPKLWQLSGVRRRLIVGWLIYTANAVGYWGMTLFLTTYIVKKFHASPINAIRYALVFFLLQVVFAYLGTALADWLGRRPSAILAALIEIASTVLAATSDSLPKYQVFGAVAIATLGWLWGVGDTYIAELFPTMLRGTGFGIAVGGGRIVSIAAPTVVGWAITHYGLQMPYLALSGLWALTLVGYLLGPETKGRELKDLADEALTEELLPVRSNEASSTLTSFRRPAWPTGQPRASGPPSHDAGP